MGKRPAHGTHNLGTEIRFNGRLISGTSHVFSAYCSKDKLAYKYLCTVVSRCVWSHWQFVYIPSKD